MELLISLYDKTLIYYPNLFFAAFFLLIFLILIFIFQTISYILMLDQVKKIKSYRYHPNSFKTNISNYPIIVTEKFIDKGIYWLNKIEVLTEKVIKKIGKEILISKSRKPRT